MSKYANSGELRTAVRFKRRIISNDADGFDSVIYCNIYGDEDPSVMVKWVNAHGSEVFAADKYSGRRTATITMRYSAKADDDTLVVFRDGDNEPWEIVSIDDVEMRHTWLEISVEKHVQSR